MDDGCGCFIAILGLILLALFMTAIGMCGNEAGQEWARELLGT